MKKYHHRPTLGVKSGNSRWTPYVDDMNFQDPVKRKDSDIRHAMLPTNAVACDMEKYTIPRDDFSLLDLASKLRRMSGGSSSAG